MENTALEQLTAYADRLMKFSDTPSSIDNIVVVASSSYFCSELHTILQNPMDY